MMEWLLDVALIGLLAATLFHALRLERALGVLKRDRAALEALVEGFNSSSRLAEQGIERLRAAADGSGRQIARQTELATALKDDLVFLTERGERLADRLDVLVRSGRALVQDAPREEPHQAAARAGDPIAFAGPKTASERPETPEPRVRSQAERDLLKALRMAR